MKSVKDILIELMKRSGGKSKVKIGDAREVLKDISEMMWEQYEAEEDSAPIASILMANGKRRAKKKAR